MAKFNAGFFWFLIGVLAMMMIAMSLYALIAPLIPFGMIGILIVGIVLALIVGTKGRSKAPI